MGNRLVGILHGCLAHRVTYQEQLAWPAVQMGQGCREVKRDGTAGLVGWMDQAAAEGGTLQPASSAACLDCA